MTTMTPTDSRRKPRRAPRQPKAADLQRLGSFPPPTAWSEQMAVDNRLLAMDCANRFAHATGIPVADLEIPAWVGLLKACRLYDPQRINPITGTPFKLSSIAVPYIRGALKHYIRDKTFSVRFPHKWRDLGPKIRRLAEQGTSPSKIAAEISAAGTAITVQEVTELLGCMKGTVELDSERSLGHAAEPDAFDQIEDQRCWDLFDEREHGGLAAYDGICQADQAAITGFILAPRRYPYPAGPLQQFDRHVRRSAGPGLPPGGIQRQPLGFEVPVNGFSVSRIKGGRTPRPSRSTADLTTAAQQLGLFDLSIEPDAAIGEP